MAVDILELITHGKEIKEGLKYVQPKSGHIRMYSVYKLRDLDEYYRWKEISLRYLQLYYISEVKRFIEYAAQFETHSFLPAYISNMIGILEACKALPSDRLYESHRPSEREIEIEKVLQYEAKYSAKSTEDDVVQSIRAFHEWHAAASVLFDKWVYASDPDWIKFQDIQSDGNAYVLRGEFNKIFSSYKKLISRLQDGRGLKQGEHNSKEEHPVKPIASGKKVNIFISYAHADDRWLERLKQHLKVISKYYDPIEYWDDTKLRGGDRWRDEISNAISKSNVAILLVSTAFLASDFISNNELPPILKKAQEEGTRILPLIVSPCAFEESEIADFQAINSPDRTLADLGEHSPETERVFLELIKCIKGLL